VVQARIAGDAAAAPLLVGGAAVRVPVVGAAVRVPVVGDAAAAPMLVGGAAVQALVAGDAAATPTAMPPATNRALKRRRLNCLGISMTPSVYDSCSSADVTLSKGKRAT